MTQIPIISQYGGIIPDKSTQNEVDFANAVYPYMLNFNTSHIPELQSFRIAVNTVGVEMNTLKYEVVSASELATTQAELATTNGATQVTLAAEQVLLATKQAELASNSANVAAFSANEALEASNTAVAMSGIDYASFTVNNGELVLGYYDETASTPSIVDGEFIITY